MGSSPKIRPVRESLREYGRGIAGGLLFSFPLLYTMEVWWTGFIATPFQLILIILFTFALLLGYDRYAGMHPEATWRAILMDSVEELGIGFLLSSALLLMLSRISFSDMSPLEIMGKVVLEAMVVSIGVSVGTAQLGMQEEANTEQSKADEELKKERQSGLGSLVVLALCGSILVGGNVAPTEEILMIGAESRPGHILAMALVSLLLCVLITFFVNFEGTSHGSASDIHIFTIVQQTTVCYLVALGASALLLWFFGRFDSVNFWTGFSQCVALGVLSSLGASAGRLLIN